MVAGAPRGRVRSRLLIALIAAVVAGSVLAAGHAGAESAVLDSLAAWHHVSRPDRVDSLATAAIAAVRARGDTLALAPLLLARGRTRAAFGMAREAEPDLRHALRMAAAVGDTAARLRALRWLSVAVGLQGRSQEAARLYRDLESLARSAGDSIHLGWAWTGRAYEHYLAGRADSAAVLYARAAATLDREGIARGAIWARNGEGLARRQAGDFAGAAAGFREALALARAAGDALNEAMALNHLGRLALFFGDPGRAEAMLAEAAAIHRRHRHHREGLLPQLDMARARQMAGRPAAAATLLDSVLASTRAHGLADLAVVATCQLADLHLAQGRPGRAAALCRDALARATPSVMADTELRLRLARSLAARDSSVAALAVLPGIDAGAAGARTLQLEVAAMRGRLLVRAGRAGEAAAQLSPLASASREPGAEALRIPLLTALGGAQLAAGRPAAARSPLLAAIGLWDAARGVPADPRWRERRGAEAAELFSLAAVAHLRAGGADAVEAAYTLVQRYKARTLRERRQTPEADLEELPATPSSRALRADVLRDGEVLLDVVAGPQWTVMFCVARDTLLAAVLPDARVTAARLRRLDAVLTSRAVADARPAVALAAALLDSLPPTMRQRLQAARRLLWCPDGEWHRLTPAVLVGAEGWLAADCEVVRVPAASLLPALRARTRPGEAAARILAIHGPAQTGGAPLAGAASETAWLAASLRRVERLDGRELAARSGTDDDPRWRRADVLHLAAHVDTVAGEPWQARVGLGIRPEARLHAAEVAAGRVEARLVVLSGCRTAGHTLSGEGLVGLATGFLAAGASSVVATLWEVDDLVTVRVMADFYGALADGRTVAAALAEAREACRRRPETAAPRHWAGFVLLGDGGHTLGIQRRRPGWPLAGGLLALAGVLVWRARRSSSGM